MDAYLILWIIFIIVGLTLFSIDLKLSVLNPHEIELKESFILCSMWIGIALLYGFFIFYFLNSSKMAEYLTAYIIEYSLSVDNMFVFLMVFTYFGIERKYQAKVLVIGILSAVIMRLIFIFVGIELVKRFSWILYFFGIILIYSGIEMFFQKDEKIEPEKNIILRLMKKYIEIDTEMKDGNFFIKKANRYIPTMMIAVLVVIETTDILFAVDSIPAVLSISQDRLIVYSSNIFAVVGLRSLYFSLAALNNYFRYLKHGISVVLVYVGIKMFISKFIHINPFFSLGVVFGILLISVIISVLCNRKGSN